MLHKMFLCGLVLFAHTAVAQEIAVPTDARKSLNVTIYNEGLGLIKDERTIDLKTGNNTLAFEGVSAQIQPETALFSGTDLTVLEQNFNFDLLSRESLLRKFLGKKVQVLNTNIGNGKETLEEAEILSVDAGVILKIGSRIEADYQGRFIFPDVPENLRDKPTLTIDLKSQKEGKQDVQLSYLTNGLTWKADYVAELNNEEDLLALNGWVTLTNTSGVTYDNAAIQFVAGKVNRVRPIIRPMMMAKSMRSFDMAQNSMAQEQLMDYHLYSLGRPTTILSNQTKQLALLFAPKVKALKEYRIDNIISFDAIQQNDYPSQSVNVTLQFENEMSSGLGLPLPAGTVRVYKANKAQQIFFVGEDSISHTPQNEKVRLTLGEAFDVTVSGKQTRFEKIGDTLFETSVELVFKNAKESPVTVKYYQNFQNNWTVLNQTIPHTKENASQALWSVEIPAKASKTLAYTVRIKN